MSLKSLWISILAHTLAVEEKTALSCSIIHAKEAIFAFNRLILSYIWATKNVRLSDKRHILSFVFILFILLI